VAGDRSDVSLRDALAELVTRGGVPGAVRHEIGASWQRSARTGLRPERFDVPHDAAFDADARMARAARPVLDQLADDLVPTRMSVLLTDAHAHLLERRAPDRHLRNQLDDISLAPGFLYAEGTIGTNAIGTALEQGQPTLVAGEEHFADALTVMACAAAPVTDPRSGRVLGVVDLTCGASDASPLMLPLARRAAREVEARLIEDARVPEQVLLQRFLRERRGAKGPLVFISQRTMITNAAADRLVGPADEILLRELAAGMPPGREDAVEIVLASGASVAVRSEAVLDGAEPIGTELRLVVAASDDAPQRPGSGGRPSLGWASLTDTERSVVALVVQGHTNKQAAERLFVSPYTVDSHLRSIFRKLDISSRVDLTRIAVAHDEPL
jgi:transcriptional regulator of acetoin/glycerol metabolism/DNA-binding CsgD family transcriptional regulator